jgi:hypothetical protein
LAIPKDLRALIRQQEGSVNDFIARSETIWEQPEHSLTAEAKKLSSEQITAEEVERVKTLADSLRKLSTKAFEQAKDADAACKHLQSKLDEAGNTAQGTAA